MKAIRFKSAGGRPGVLIPIIDGLFTTPLPTPPFTITRIVLNNGGVGGEWVCDPTVAKTPLSIDETVTAPEFATIAESITWLNEFMASKELGSRFNIAAGNYLNLDNMPERFETGSITVVAIENGEYDNEYDIEYK